MRLDPADDWDAWCASMTIADDATAVPFRREEPPAREGDVCWLDPEGEEDISW